jgi:hypothetical protein
MKNFILVPSLVATALGLLPAQAGTFTANFPTTNSTIVASVGVLDDPTHLGGFWSVSRGDSVEQAFVGTGVAHATQLQAHLLVPGNSLSPGRTEYWQFSLNGIPVGDFAVASEDGVGARDLEFNFPPLPSTGDYTVRLAIQNEIPDGGGAIWLSTESWIQITAVPEPSSVALAVVAESGRRGLHPAGPQRQA